MLRYVGECDIVPFRPDVSRKALKGVPTCYIFACPQDNSPRPPFHALLPQGSSREPGLILVSAGGKIRFWESIGIGLAGGDNFSASSLEDMDSDEEVTNLVRADVSCCPDVASRSHSNDLRLTHTSSRPRMEDSIAWFSPQLVENII
jgi:nuclear pore complex protein Nup133